ncbi:MAG: hypothetical protein RLZZ155_814 [Bacteroidota bacterium]
MKKNILALLLTLASAGVFAQLPVGPHYLFTTYTSGFAPIQEGNSLDGGQIWDDPTWTVPLGFTFYTANDTITTLYVGELGTTVYGIQDDSLSDVFLPYFDDIANADNDTLVSPVSYVVEGPPGFQICKIEWLNVGFYEDWAANGTYTNTTSFQLWLYENSNIFEYHYGPSNISNPSVIHMFGAPASAFVENLNQNTGFDWDGFYSLTGNTDAPTITTVTNAEVLASQGIPSYALLNGEPAEGTVYRFAPTFVNVEENSLATFEVFPNPTSGLLNVFNPTQEVVVAQILSAEGKVVQIETLNSGRNSIQTENLSSGYYILRVNGTSTSFLKN